MEPSGLPLPGAGAAAGQPAVGSTLPSIPLHLPPGATLWCFDLGTAMGICTKQAGTPFRSWTLHLATREELEQQRRDGKERSGDLRFERYFIFLNRRVKPGDLIFVEDVGFPSSRIQSQLWASFRSAIWAIAVLHPGVQVFAVPVGTLKQFATGKTSAQKFEMARALASRRPLEYQLIAEEAVQKTDGSIADHNEIDAIWLALYAEAIEKGERSFLTAYRRKQLKVQNRRQKKAERRERKRLRKAAETIREKANKRAIRAVIRSLGTCCGVLRKRSRRHAVCPKCGARVPLPKITVPPFIPGSATAGLIDGESTNPAVISHGVPNP